MVRTRISDDKIVYSKCPCCNSVRRKEKGKYTIVKRGYERNGFARFLCLQCGAWYNEKTGDSMRWYAR